MYLQTVEELWLESRTARSICAHEGTTNAPTGSVQRRLQPEGSTASTIELQLGGISSAFAMMVRRGE